MVKDVDEGKVVAILLWLFWIVGLIWYLVDDKMKKNTFVKYWLKQWLVMVIIGVCLGVVGGFLSIVTLGLFGIIMFFIWIAYMILWIMGLIKIIQGKSEPVPIIGKYGEKWFKF